ncbi:hypothetical protein B194_1995 [Serratia plymuthica A30]|uniref:Shedu anti-phage system protein SduA domain-containing protein n=1 Tax=Serratia plymuthica TaxID=82996 RepID=UPI0002A32B77|nr:Shedu anti-phage system protein SduA domain-containing protein [Serratia plymuthica]EKF65042.1 hypothetical protein B194_1995 [Serratia plymuthica A30]
MEIEKFAITCKRALDRHFKKVKYAYDNGYLVSQDGSSADFFYPTTILCAKTEEVFSVELIGISKKIKPLKIKKYSNLSFDKLISYCDKVENSNAQFVFSGSIISLKHMLLTNDIEYLDEKQERFPIVSKFPTKIVGDENAQNLFAFDANLLTASFKDVVVVTCKNNTFRARYIYEMLIFKNKIEEEELQQLLLEHLDFSKKGSSVFGAQKIKTTSDIKEVQVSYLHNMILRNEIHETTIGDYLNENIDIILSTLGYTDAIYEPTLYWIEKTPDNTDISINPDFLLQRKDGFYDICDLKKGLVNRKNLTKGERRRRRFIDAVNEGIAQLDNYAEYFTFEKNAEHASEKYEVKTRNPFKILIVGNLENTVDEEVKQALRGRSDLLVIDYDSIIYMFLARITNEAISN